MKGKCLNILSVAYLQHHEPEMIEFFLR